MRSMTLTTKVKLGLLILVLAFAAAVPYLLSPFLVAILTVALIMGLFAMSIDLLAGYGGLTTLGQAGILATAGYGAGYMAVRQDASYPVQILVGLAAGFVITLVFAAMVMRTRGIYFIMVTVAQGMIIWGLALRLADFTGAENGLRGIVRPPSVAAYWQYYYVCLIVVAICGALLWVITRSPFGLSWQGLRESEERLAMVGYNVTLHKFYGFVLSGSFATISGVLFVYRDQFISPASSEFLASGNGVLMAILGGLGTLIGPMIGAAIIVLTENVLSSYIERWPTLLGIVFIVTILFARQGLVGAVSQMWHRWLRGRSATEEEVAAGAGAASVAGGDRADEAHEPKTQPAREQGEG